MINIIHNLKYTYNNFVDIFGITEDYQNVVVDNFKPTFKLPENLFITGDSGSGKTSLLKTFNLPILTLEQIPIKPLLEWGELFNITDTQLTQYLSGVGLCDVKLFSRDISTFSESQKYRVMLLYGIIKYDVIIIDEFLSLFDRKSAKPIAFAFQKLCRKINKNFIVASPHDDIIDYLKPDKIWVGEVFTGKWIEKELEYNKTYPDEISIREVPIKGINKHSLLNFHYQQRLPGNLKKCSLLSLNGVDIGIILIGKDFFSRETHYIRRLVIHPNYRGCGFSKLLVNKYKDDYEDFRILSKMLTIIPFLSGKDYSYENSPKKSILNYFNKLNFNWNNLDSCVSIMSDEKHRKFLSQYYQVGWKMYMQKNDKLSLDDRIKMINESNLTAGTILFYIRERETPGFYL